MSRQFYTIKKDAIVLHERANGEFLTEKVQAGWTEKSCWCEEKEIVSRTPEHLLKIKKSYFPEGFFVHVHASDLIPL